MAEKERNESDAEINKSVDVPPACRAAALGVTIVHTERAHGCCLLPHYSHST